jgi:hypothetical protein
MSSDEFDAMVGSGEVQVGGGGTTYVASPADAAAYERQAGPGSYYAEFNVPTKSLYPAGREGWAQIPSPEHVLGRLAAERGSPLDFPVPATDISHVATRLP